MNALYVVIINRMTENKHRNISIRANDSCVSFCVDSARTVRGM
jgi:hypothetical protein